MSVDYEVVVHGICEAFDLSPAILRTSPVLADLVTEAASVLEAERIVARVVGRGPVAGTRNPYGVVVARVRQLVRALEDEACFAAEAESERRGVSDTQARKRAAVLAELVLASDLPLDAAEAELASVLERPTQQEVALAELHRYLDPIRNEVPR
jgi:hypothetical protein